MAYSVTITNNYHEAIRAFGTIIHATDTRPVTIEPPRGNGFIDVPALGAVNFIDVGKDNLGGYSKSTWGVLLSYQGEELIFRYEGKGEIHVNINKYGQAELSGNGGFSQIPLPSFVVK